MRNSLLLTVFLLIAFVSISGQTSIREVVNVTSNPTGASCARNRLYKNTVNNTLWQRNSVSGLCEQITGGSSGVALGDTPTWTGAHTWSKNSAASTPTLRATGTWFSGGTSTTTKPHFLVEPAGTTSTNWSTSGTGIGVNASSGFAGRLLELQVNGASKLYVDQFGQITNPAGAGGIKWENSFDIGQAASAMITRSDWLYSWSNTTSTTTPDVGIGRNAAGVLEINNATAGGLGKLLAARVVTAKTTGYTVLSADKSTFFTNTGAGAGVTFTLPTPVAGMTYEFYRDANQTVTIDVATGVTIRVGASVTTDGGNATLDAVGSRLRIVAISTTQWVGDISGTVTFN